jgi:hypothetical protein
MAPLQKRALYEFVSLIVLTALLGPLLFFASDGRLLYAAVPIAALAYWIPRHLTRPRPDQPVVMDERDKVILGKVTGFQRLGIVLAIFVWFSVLFFRADAHGQVTISQLSLMLLMWSVFIADAVSSVLGTLIAYWRSK